MFLLARQHSQAALVPRTPLDRVRWRFSTAFTSIWRGNNTNQHGETVTDE